MVHILNATGGSKEIDEIKYELPPNERDKKWMKKDHPLMTLDWQDLIPAPPDNTSDSTKVDLEELQRITRNISKEDFDLVMLVDDEPYNLFAPYLKKND